MDDSHLVQAVILGSWMHAGMTPAQHAGLAATLSRLHQAPTSCSPVASS
jgi:hypothetical protein